MRYRKVISIDACIRQMERKDVANVENVQKPEYFYLLSGHSNSEIEAFAYSHQFH